MKFDYWLWVVSVAIATYSLAELEGDHGDKGKSQETDSLKYILGQYEIIDIFIQGMWGKEVLGESKILGERCNAVF